MNDNIIGKYRILIFTFEEHKDIFSDLQKIELICCKNDRLNPLRLLYLVKKNKVDVLFPMGTRLDFMGIKTISWIADMQHIYLKEFFEKKEIRSREKKFRSLSKRNKHVILSSNICKEDFYKFYSPQIGCVVEVMPFVSYITPFIAEEDADNDKECLIRYGLWGKKYACVMNQFWQHKNHVVVINAIEKIISSGNEDDFIYVFTGRIEDYRSKEYITLIKSLLEKEEIRKKILVLGFLPRNEQLTIMRYAQYVIQPSLFEGWGTVLEDAKVLDKTVLLSDIPIHREQKNENCIFFDPYNADMLAAVMLSENSKGHTDNISYGVLNLKKRAEDYSKGFERMLYRLEKGEK